MISFLSELDVAILCGCRSFVGNAIVPLGITSLYVLLSNIRHIHLEKLTYPLFYGGHSSSQTTLSHSAETHSTSTMVFGTTTYRPAKKISPSSTPTFPDVDDVSKVFRKPSWGFLPVPGGPDILRSGPPTTASDRALEVLSFAGGSCEWALEQVQAIFGLDAGATALSEAQLTLFTSLATQDLSGKLDLIREKGLRDRRLGSEDSQFYILDVNTWDELLSDTDACLRVIRQEPEKWTASGVREVVEAWDKYVNPSAVSIEDRQDVGDDSDESEVYEDARENLDSLEAVK